VADYLPHTEEDVASMLAFLGMDSLDDLFAHIPQAIRLANGLDVADGLSEPDVAAIFAGYTSANKAKATSMICFAGGGA
jgi:glycine dehydrogenase subunit 1